MVSSAAMTFPERYHSLTLWIAGVTGLPDPVLHIHAGLAVLLVARFISGRPLGSFIPFLCVVLVEAGNEVLDYLASGWRPADTASDIVNTLFWPFVLSLAVRLRPAVGQACASKSVLPAQLP